MPLEPPPVPVPLSVGAVKPATGQVGMAEVGADENISILPLKTSPPAACGPT